MSGRGGTSNLPYLGKPESKPEMGNGGYKEWLHTLGSQTPLHAFFSWGPPNVGSSMAAHALGLFLSVLMSQEQS